MAKNLKKKDLLAEAKAIEITVKSVDNKKVRFSDAEWFIIGPQDIIIGGVGGIGSWVALLLSRIGHSLYLYDTDIIDETNMGGQFYAINQIGISKAQATKTNIMQFSGNPNVETMGNYNIDSMASPIMFSCFDNMTARKAMFDNWEAQENRELFIDGRMLAEVGIVFCVMKGQESLYRNCLFEDSEIEDSPCSYKSTSHCGTFISSLMVTGLNNYLTNKFHDMDIRITQFRTDFELPLISVQETIENLPKLIVKTESINQKAANV